MEVSVSAIILGAGQGERIGQPKIYLKIGDRYFLDIICENLILAGFKNICSVVTGLFDTTQFFYRDKISWVINKNPELGMISSIYYGIQSTPVFQGYLIVPVDHPKILRKTFHSLYNVFLENSDSVVMTSYNDILGHPIIIPRSVAEKIEERDYPGGLKGIVESSDINIISVETDDPGVLKNVNTKNDLLDL